MAVKKTATRVYHYAKSDSGKKTALWIGAGILLIYGLSKIKIGGDSITDKIGGGLGDIVGGALGGVVSGAGNMLGGAAGGLGQGAGNLAEDIFLTAPAKFGSGLLEAPINAITGGKGTEWRNEGLKDIEQYGWGQAVGMAFQPHHKKLRQVMQPQAHWIEKDNPFYKYTVTGRSYMTEHGEALGVQYNELLKIYPKPIDASFVMFVQNGGDPKKFADPSRLSAGLRQQFGV